MNAKPTFAARGLRSNRLMTTTLSLRRCSSHPRGSLCFDYRHSAWAPRHANRDLRGRATRQDAPAPWGGRLATTGGSRGLRSTGPFCDALTGEGTARRAMAGWGRPGGAADSSWRSAIMNLMEDQQAPHSAEGEAKVITLCGSTTFEVEFAEVNRRLTMEGCVVISLGMFRLPDLPDYDWTVDSSDLKGRLGGVHRQKIRMA